MASAEAIHETIAKMRQRVLEIDSLIARMERARTCVHVIGGTDLITRRARKELFADGLAKPPKPLP